VKTARDGARALAGQAVIWKSHGYPPNQNPFIVKKHSTETTKPAKCPTFFELKEAYLLRHVREHASRPDKAELRVNQLCKYLKDWNDRPIDGITVHDVLAVKNAQAEHRVTANRLIEFVRCLFNWSAKSTDGKINFWKVENPAKDVSRHKEVPRERFLLPQELAQFNKALKEAADADLRDFVTLSLSTGARRGDLLSMAWKDVFWEACSWHIPKPKNSVPYEVALLPVAMEVLKRRHAQADDEAIFVFPGRGRTGHLMDLKRNWQEFRKRANCEDLRVHDLRRTCGSYLAMSGVGLAAVGQALGHRSMASTAIYARFDSTAVRSAREQGAAKMVEMMRKASHRIARKLKPIATKSKKLLTGGR
jgi:integrase